MQNNFSLKKIILTLYGLFISCTVLSSSIIAFDTPIISTALKYLSILFFLIALGISIFKSLNNQYGKRSLIILLILGTTIILNVLFSKNFSLYYIYIFGMLIFLKDIHFIYIFKVCFFSLFSTTFLLIILSKCSIITNLISYRIEDGVRMNTREALGFTHPNIAAFNLMIITILSIFILSINVSIGRSKKLIYIVSILICLLINQFITDSRSAVVISVIAIVATYISKFFSVRKLYKLIFIIASILILISILSMIVNTENIIFKEFNLIFNNRLISNNNFFSQYGIHFFGNVDVTMHNFSNNLNGINNNLILDNAFVRLLVINGIFSTVIYFLIIGATAYKAIKEKNKFVLIFIFITLTSMFSESQFIVNYGLSLSLILCTSNMREVYLK